MREQLDRVLASATFADAERVSRFLRFVVQASLGTYVVNSDCTGSMLLTVSAGPKTYTNHVDLVVVHGAAEFRAINTDPGSVITTIGKKQFSKED